MLANKSDPESSLIRVALVEDDVHFQNALMSVSSHTVQTHVRRICAEPEVHSKTEAVYEARSQGLLTK